MAINVRRRRADSLCVGAMNLIKQRVRADQCDSAGFSMVEVIVSLVIIAIVTTAALAFFLNDLKSDNGQKQRQQAVFVADQQLEQIKALPSSEISTTNLSSKLVYGRTLATQQALWSSPQATALKLSSQDDETSAYDYDTDTSHTTFAENPNGVTSLNNLNYNWFSFIDVCWLTPSSGICGPTSSASTTMDYRATVAVTWTSSTCKNGCMYSDSTLIDPNQDSTFNTNISAPTGSITAESNTQYFGPTLSTGQFYNDSGVGTTNTCKPNNTTYYGTLVTVTGSGFQAGMTIKLSGSTRDSGSVVTASIYQGSATTVSFCLATGDQPGSYTLNFVNPDKGHFPLAITEVPSVFAATGWTPSGKALTLTGGGIEPNATVSLGTSSTSTCLSSTPACSFGTTTVTAPPTSDTAPANSTVVLSNWVGPSNGKVAILTVTNPDTTTASYTITAPSATGTSTVSSGSGYTGAGIPAGQPVTRYINGSGFEAGAGINTNVTTGTTVPTVPAVSATQVAVSGIQATGAVNSTAVVGIYNPDGGTTTETFTTDALPTVFGKNNSVANFNGNSAATTISNGDIFSQISGLTANTVSLTGGSGYVAGMTVADSVAGTISISAITSTTATVTILPTSAVAEGTTDTITLTNPDQGYVNFNMTVETPPMSTNLSASPTQKHGTTSTWTLTGSGYVSGASILSFTEGTGSSAVSLATPLPALTCTSGSCTFSSAPPSSTLTGNQKFVLTIANPDGGQSTETKTLSVQ